MSFVHLHNHTHYSLLDGLSRPEELVQKAVEFGSPAIAITDHGVLYGAIEFYKAAKKAGIKPIIGCEMYITKDRSIKDPSVKRSNHLLLLAKNKIGYQNLMKLVSIGYLEGFYYRPRIDHEVLKEHSEGLIATSGCLIGEIPQALLSDDMDLAYKLVDQYQSIFGKDNFYLEVQHHPAIDEQIIVNKKILDLGKELDIPVIATNDCHYLKSEDAHAHDILVCIQTGKTLLDDDRMRYTSDFSLASPEEMAETFKDNPEVLKNTLEIAEKCNLELEFDQNLLPKFTTPNGETAEEYLKGLCLQGIEERYEGETKEKALKRLDYELEIINSMGFADYFLIVHDFISYAKKNGIVVGPGRGSAAGSLTTYSLDITTVDPLKYGLLFERFLNPERVSMPDIDIDFADHRRDEILTYVIDKYGRDNVAQVITFGRLTAKAAVRDVGRAMGYPYSEVDAISKLIPAPILGQHRPLPESVVEDAGLSAEYNKNPRAKELLDNAIKLEGTIRNAGTHACAVIISEEPLTNYTPLQLASGKDDTIVTQYSMKPLEEIGLLKMDFLGLRNLTILENVLVLIKEDTGEIIDIDKVPLDDEATFKLLSRGDTTGVFQLESGGMRRYLKELIPSQFEDIIAMNALYRPGPMDYIPDYIKGKHDPKSIKYMHPDFEPILKETYGVGVYQEQILEIARTFANFTLGEADLLRKAVGKKDPELLADQRQKFIEGAESQGHDAKFAKKVFDDVIEPFAGYGFNKAHATCYAMIAYQTAYLKAHYPTEFMAALLTSNQNDRDRVSMEINEALSMGIDILQPSINDSNEEFTVVDSNTIRFGLNAIKGLGSSSVEKIILARKEYGRFENLQDFAAAMPPEILNKKTIVSLAYAGAFDDFGLPRNQIAENYETIRNYARNLDKDVDTNQIDIFAEVSDEKYLPPLELESVEIVSGMELLALEKEYIGLYVSKHPLQGLGEYIKRKVTFIANLSEKHKGKKVKVGGLITSKKKILTRKGDYMMNLTLEDQSGSIEVMIFPKVYNQLVNKVQDNKFIMIEGNYEIRRNPQIVAHNITPCSIEIMIENAKEASLYNPQAKFVDWKQNTITEESYEVIVLPASIEPTKLQELKRLLENSKGLDGIELHMQDNKGGIKKIRLANKIDFNDSFKEKLNKLLS